MINSRQECSTEYSLCVAPRLRPGFLVLVLDAHENGKVSRKFEGAVTTGNLVCRSSKISGWLK